MMASVTAINNLGGHAHNPRGNLWFNDESTYGHKLLMKMGWNKGKGLGKNEDGIKENLKVKFRNTNSGLGFKDDAYANVMKTEYESILKNLASEYSCSGTTNLTKNVNNFNSDQEPMQNTKVVKSKLRYPRLFFGKDVTKYTEKDMKSIFICSAQLKSIERKSENTVIPDKRDFESESPQAFDTYSSCLNISDYFAKKMEEKKNNTLKNYSSNSSIHQQTSLESKNSIAPILTSNESRTFKRKMKHAQVDIKRESIDVEEPCQVVIETEAVATEDVASSNKKSPRKKKKAEISIKGTEVNSSDVEPCVTNIEKDALESSFCKNISSSSNICAIENITNQNSSRLNKKRKISQVFENDSVESSLSPAKKKKKKCKKYSATVQLSSENALSQNDKPPAEIHKEINHFSLEPEEGMLSNNTSCSKKKKKSKKKLKEKLKSCLKSRCSSYSLKNVSFNKNVSYRIIDSKIESVDSLACSENFDENTASFELTDSENKLRNDTYSEEESIYDEHNLNNNVCVNEQCKVPEESDKECALVDLPAAKSSHYNAWIESQRQALKMQLYKKMLKSIKNHKILKTTNLLSIKGYGNWGYKKK